MSTSVSNELAGLLSVYADVKTIDFSRLVVGLLSVLSSAVVFLRAISCGVVVRAKH